MFGQWNQRNQNHRSSFTWRAHTSFVPMVLVQMHPPFSNQKFRVGTNSKITNKGERLSECCCSSLNEKASLNLKISPTRRTAGRQKRCNRLNHVPNVRHAGLRVQLSKVIQWIVRLPGRSPCSHANPAWAPCRTSAEIVAIPPLPTARSREPHSTMRR